MTNFSNLLKQYIKKKNVKIASLSRYCNYDRPTLYKIIQGKRNPPSLSMVKQISQFLNLTLSEASELTTTYYQALLGKKIYSEFQTALDFTLSFDSDEASVNSFGQVQYNNKHFSADIKKKEFLALNTTAALTNALFYAFVKCAEGNKKVTLLLQPSTVYMNDFFIHSISLFKLNITHILCLSNHDDDHTGLYNINCLKQTLSFLKHSDHYDVSYYYDNAQARFDNYTLFPFLLLTDDCAITFNSDFSSGIYSSSRDIITLYQDQTHALLSNTLPLYKTFHGILEECTAFSELVDNSCILEYDPCFVSFISNTILNHIVKDFPERDATIQFINQYLRLLEHAFRNNKCFSYFTIEGLDHFVENGKISAVPDTIYRPLNVAERIKILMQTLPYVQKGHYRIVKKNLSKIDLNFHISLHNETTVAIYIRDSDNQLMLTLVEEPLLFSIFKNFFEHLDIYDYFYSLEETLEIFNRALSKLHLSE